MPLSALDIRSLIALGRERSGVEFKGAGSRTDSPFKGKVVRGILAMANRRDGGLVLLGIKEQSDGGLAIEGLAPDQLATWRHDHLADTVAEYADPRIEFDSYFVDVDGQTIVVIAISEFPEFPVICKRALSDGRPLLRDGAVYVRSNRKPESREVANYDEMRELLEMATDKGIRRFLTRASAVGLLTGSTSNQGSEVAFETERGNL